MLSFPSFFLLGFCSPVLRWRWSLNAGFPTSKVWFAFSSLIIFCFLFPSLPSLQVTVQTYLSSSLWLMLTLFWPVSYRGDTLCVQKYTAVSSAILRTWTRSFSSKTYTYCLSKYRLWFWNLLLKLCLMGLVHLKVSLLLVFGESRCLLSLSSFLPLTLSLLQIYPVIFFKRLVWVTPWPKSSTRKKVRLGVD